MSEPQLNGDNGVRFCRLPSGHRVAWKSLGDGPPLVMVPGWLSHVDELWTHPAAASARDKLAMGGRFIWYDRLGCGLSDREGFEPSLENDVEQLTAVLDAAGVERADLIGYSFGGPPAVDFAQRQPERVRRLVLYASYAWGARLSSPEAHEGLKALVRADWALGSRALATLFLPNGSAHDLRWFARFQRHATEAEMAARLLDLVRSQDVRDQLPSLRVATLVLANSKDSAVPMDNARELATNIPGATLHLLTGNEHDPFIRDSGGVVEAIRAFVDGRPLAAPETPAPPAAMAALTPREEEVLRLIAAGESNKTIAKELGIEVATVERHISNIYGKLGARGRADATMMAVAMRLAPVPPV